MRSVPELLSNDDAWPGLSAAINDSPTDCMIVPPDGPSWDCLHSLQVSTRSVLGALAFHVGALLIDHGWIRLFGSGHSSLPSIAAANPFLQSGVQPESLAVGEDVLGGKFAINGGGLTGELGEVNFWAPDTLEWECLEFGYGDFVYWLIGGGGAALYDSLRWPDWEAEVSAIGLDKALMLYPPPCAIEGTDTANVSRRAVPRAELANWLTSLSEVPEGSVEFKLEP